MCFAGNVQFSGTDKAAVSTAENLQCTPSSRILATDNADAPFLLVQGLGTCWSSSQVGTVLSHSCFADRSCRVAFTEFAAVLSHAALRLFTRLSLVCVLVPACHRAEQVEKCIVNRVIISGRSSAYEIPQNHDQVSAVFCSQAAHALPWLSSRFRCLRTSFVRFVGVHPGSSNPF
jgi:hypothetical protein